MKRWIIFAIVAATGIAALAWSERHPVRTRATPAAILYFVADSEWELSRLPLAATRLSDQEEIEIGNQLAGSPDRFEAERTPDQKRQADAVQAYVSRVGARVAAHAHRKLPYKFHYIPDMDFVNAYALPGGHVYIGAGLVSLMDSDDELAAVLGHEIEHIDHYHCAERVQTEARMRRLPLGDLAAIPVSLFEVGYSKDQELEADREGTQLAVWAGYSPLGALRMFETFDRLYQEYVRRAKSPQDELSSMAIETLEGYFRTHPLPSERIEQIDKLIAANNWGGLNHERDLEVAYIFWTMHAQQAYEAGHYDLAVGLAQRSLKMQPDQTAALMALGHAQFAQANFADAAAAFRKLVDLSPSEAEYIVTYCDALAARHTPAESLQEYATWLDSHPEVKGHTEVGLQTRLELGRLTLAARGAQAADASLFPTVSADASNLPPNIKGRYGWWYYQSGNIEGASKWLQSAVEERPGDAVLQSHLGWVLVEQRNLETAIQRFQTSTSDESSTEYGLSGDHKRTSNERRMGLAVAEWQAQQPGNALSEFYSVSIAQPEWLNPKWVAALYSPGVVKTVEELKAAQKKRFGPHALATNRGM